VEIRKPEKGIIISEGRGMQADSIAIARKTPKYPNFEIKNMAMLAKNSRI
jgi:hypothetical protein